MYYSESIVDGVLCHRGTPNGKWIPFTAKELTEKLVSAQQQLHDIEQLKEEQGI